MSDDAQRMSEQDAREILFGIDERVLSLQPERIMTIFRALVTVDVWRIEQLAGEAIDALDPEALGDQGQGIEGLVYQVVMEVFRDSLLAVLEERCPEIEPEIEFDIPTWIEANAPLATLAHIRVMEAALPGGDPLAHRFVIELHQRIDLERYEAEQSTVLLSAWAGIEAAIRERLAQPPTG